MDKLLYVAMTGASQNALAQKAHANNLANISTNGFQRDLEQARSMPVFGDSFPARAFAMTERPATDFSEGALVETGRELDVAVAQVALQMLVIWLRGGGHGHWLHSIIGSVFFC